MMLGMKTRSLPVPIPSWNWAAHRTMSEFWTFAGVWRLTAATGNRRGHGANPRFRLRPCSAPRGRLVPPSGFGLRPSVATFGRPREPIPPAERRALTAASPCAPFLTHFTRINS